MSGVEFKVPPLPPEVTGQNRGNSGVGTLGIRAAPAHTPRRMAERG